MSEPKPNPGLANELYGFSMSHRFDIVLLSSYDSVIIQKIGEKHSFKPLTRDVLGAVPCFRAVGP